MYWAMAVMMAALLLAPAANAQFQRLVVVEEFTSSTCPPCAPATPIVNRYTELEDGVISVRYHMNFPNGGGDPLYLSVCDQRMFTYYGNNSIPYARINGVDAHNPGPTGEADFAASIDRFKGLTSPIQITIDHDQSDLNDTKFKVTVLSNEALNNATLHVFVVNRQIEMPNLSLLLQNRHNGETEFRDVIMHMLPDANGTAISLEAEGTQEFNFDYSRGTDAEAWPEGQTYITAFIQSNLSREVLQAGTTFKGDIKPDFVLTGDRYTIVPNLDQFTREFTVTNTSDRTETFELAIDNADLLPEGWSAIMDKSEVTLDAGASANTTVTVNTGGSAAFGAISVRAKGEPRYDGFITQANASDPAGGLTANTKYMHYYGFNDFQGDQAQSFASLQNYGSETALVPFNTDVLMAFPVENYDVAIYSLRATFASSAVSTVVTNHALGMYRAGKSVFFTSGISGLRALTNNGDADPTFFSEIFGLTTNDYVNLINHVVNNTIQPLQITGFAGDPIADGIDVAANTTVQNFIFASDIFNIADGGDVKKVFYLNNNQVNVGGIRTSTSEGAKIAYYTFGLEAIGDATQRGNIIRKTMDWLTSAGGDAPVISSNVNALNFESVDVGEDKTLILQVSNDGTADLEISNITISGTGAAAFELVSNPSLTIAPNQTESVRVEFAPLAQENYEGTLQIASNATEGTFDVSLSGSGIVTSVRDVEVGENASLSLTAGPNPFNSVTAISYTIKGDTPQTTKLSIFNNAGQEVAVLHNELTQPGTYNASFDGVALPAGTYFAKLSTPNEAVMLTVVLVK
jgi:hypothetical protein